MIDAAVGPFTARVAAVRRAPPSTAWISNVTGTWITKSEAIDPAYWGRHLRQPVRFADGVRTLAEDPSRVFLEVGPGQSLSNLVRPQHSRVIATMRPAQESVSDCAVFLTALGKLWLAGATVRSPQPQRRVPLPTYPFERRRYWIQPPAMHWLGPTPADARPAASRELTVEGDATAADSTAASAPALRADHPLDAEQSVTAIWRELLGRERIGTRDHFFELGGDSLLATQMASRIRETCRVPLSLEAVLIEPTINAIAGRVRALAAGQHGYSVVPLEPVRRDGPLPLSFAQQRLFFLHQLVPDSPFYNVPVAVRVAGALDVDALVRGVAAIVQRHEILRTTVAVEDGQPVQRVHEAMPPDVRFLDLEGEPQPVRDARAAEAIGAAVRDAFDLLRGPMVRVAVVRMGRDLHQLAIVMHHIVCDAWSIGVFLQELATLYTANVRGQDVSLPPLALQYGDVAVWERRRFEGERLGKELEYWTQRLGGAAPLRLRGARRVDDVASFRAGVDTLTLGADVATALKQVGRDEGATLFTVLLSVFLILLRHHSDQDDIVVGTDVANRHERATEALIGFFINQLVLRTDLSGNPTFRDVVHRAHKTTVRAFSHQDLPFDRLVEALNPARDARSTLLFNVKLVLQNAPTPRLVLPELTLGPLAADTGAAKFDLLFNLEEIGGRIAGNLEYNADRFAAATVATMLSDFEAVAHAVGVEPELRLTDLDARLNATKRQTPAQKLVELQRQMSLPNARRRAVSLPVETS